jgi:hypothetical protein
VTAQHGIHVCGLAVASTNKSLAQMSKPPKVAAGVVQKYPSDQTFNYSIYLAGHFDLPQIKSNIPGLECNLVPPHFSNWLEPFPSMAALNRPLA